MGTKDIHVITGLENATSKGATFAYHALDHESQEVDRLHVALLAALVTLREAVKKYPQLQVTVCGSTTVGNTIAEIGGLIKS